MIDCIFKNILHAKEFTVNILNKSLNSINIAISYILLTFVYGLFGLIITRLIILNYGSDVNGLNSTVTQFINMLLVIEGGFTLSINVALFSPIINQDFKTINSILSASKIIFLKIGLIFLCIGTIFSVGYIFILKTEISKEIASVFFLLTIFSTVFNLSFTTKYKILLLAEQKEYIINYVNIIITIVFQTIIIYFIIIKTNILFIRFILAFSVIVNGIIIAFYCKYKYGYLNFNEKPNYKDIKGTGYVFVQKITAVIYATVPIVYISATVGTLYASIYFVYNSIFSLLKNIVYSFINAPRIGFGQLILEKNNAYVFNVFNQYQLLINIITVTILSVATVMIIPFMHIYMDNAKDISYVDFKMAYLMVSIAFFELIHIPSGNIINMSGNFKIAKNIQLFACFIIIITMYFGNKYLGFYGIIFSVLFTSIILAMSEIYYIVKVYFMSKLYLFFKLLYPSMLVSFLLVNIEIKFICVFNYISFAYVSVFVFLLNFLIIVLVNIFFNKLVMFNILLRVKNLIINLHLVNIN